MRLAGWVDRDEREPASFSGVIILASDERHAVIISNVSGSGCRVECDVTLPIGAGIELEVGDERVVADVRWALHGSAGLRWREH